MADNKKALIGLDCLITNKVECKGCPYNVGRMTYCIESIAQEAKDTIEKQESEILDFIESVARLTAEKEKIKADRPEIVRCKYCKNGGLDSSGINGYWCSAHTEWHNGNWFCADGERQKGQ